MCNAQTPVLTYQVSLDSPEEPMITIYCTCTVVCMLLLYPCVHSAADNVKNVIYLHNKIGERGKEMRKNCPVMSMQNPY